MCLYLLTLYLLYAQYGLTALSEASRNGQLKTVELLISANADVNILDNVSHIIYGVCVLAGCVHG